MDLGFSAEDRAFQQSVRTFLRERLPSDLAEKMRRAAPLGREDLVRWQKILHERGWAAPLWPEEHGGPGWSPIQRYIFEIESALHDAPLPPPFGIQMLGPVVYTFGTEEQQRRFLPPTLAADILWCQGYSEPGAGSDLATLQTRAVRDGDHYVVTGSKTWTSQAHWADWIFCLVRTSSEGKPQEGISFLLIEMDSPGLSVKPIPTIDGGHHVNMTYFDEVRVPLANRIGEENKGWTYAKFLLGHERVGIAEVGPSLQRLRLLKRIAGEARAGDGRSLSEVPGFAARLAEAELALSALEYTSLRALAEEAQGRPVGPEASLLKIRGSEVRQHLTELAVEVLGYYGHVGSVPAQPHSGNEPPIGPDLGVVPDYLFSRAATIYGGSNEIQRNIIAKAVLGLQG